MSVDVTFFHIAHAEHETVSGTTEEGVEYRVITITALDEDGQRMTVTLFTNNLDLELEMKS